MVPARNHQTRHRPSPRPAHLYTEKAGPPLGSAPSALRGRAAMRDGRWVSAFFSGRTRWCTTPCLIPVERPKAYKFSKHAEARAAERGISLKLFQETVEKHHSKRQQRRSSNGGFVYMFERQYSEKRLHVVVEICNKECTFLTGYWTQATDEA